MDKYDVNYYDDIVKNMSDECKKLVSNLKDTKFFVNPASNKYHHVYDGGLAQHSMEVFHNLCELASKDSNINVSTDTLFLIGIGHDLDKIGRYRSKYNNFAYIPKKRLAQYHGGNSFAILKSYLGESFDDNPDYALIHLCIYTHMGDFGEIHPKSEFHKYKDEMPLVNYTFMADMVSCDSDKLNSDKVNTND